MGLHITFCASHIEPMMPILDQVAYLDSEERRTPDTSYCVAFLNAKTFPRLDQLDIALSQDLPTSLEPPADLVAFTLFVGGGPCSPGLTAIIGLRLQAAKASFRGRVARPADCM